MIANNVEVISNDGGYTATTTTIEKLSDILDFAIRQQKNPRVRVCRLCVGPYPSNKDFQLLNAPRIKD